MKKLFNKLFGKSSENTQAQVESTPVPQAAAPVVTPKKPRKPRTKKPDTKPDLSPKDAATAAGEPYVNILALAIDPADINSGEMTLDWNDKFVLNLIRAGYKIREDDSDQDIVNRWFTQVCRNVALEMYEQQQADPDNRPHRDLRVANTKDLGNGRTEVS